MSRGVRLSSGRLRGRLLRVPTGVRPTEGRVREALFNILGPGLEGESFLDLFSGSGAMALQAFALGASPVVAVEGSASVLKQLRATLAELGAEAIDTHRLELPRQLDRLAERRFHWIFADPPYAFEDYGTLVLGALELLEEGGRFVLEHDRRVRPELPPGVERLDLRTYGETALSFFGPT